mgnify:CR=1 FL=1
MIPFASFFQSKKISWQKAREEKWKKEYLSKELEHVDKLSILERKKADLDDIEKRIIDRKIELETANKELKEQIRLMEAKAKPDSVWIQAFGMGFSKAWDMSLPIMSDGIENLKEKIRTKAIDDTLDGLESTIEKRIERAKLFDLKPVNEVISKKEYFQNLKNSVKTEKEKEKCQHYIEALDWLINGNVSKKD